MAKDALPILFEEARITLLNLEVVHKRFRDLLFRAGGIIAERMSKAGLGTWYYRAEGSVLVFFPKKPRTETGKARVDKWAKKHLDSLIVEGSTVGYEIRNKEM